MKEYSVAVVGATGLVGRTMVAVLEERRFPVKRLVPLASERSAGTTILRMAEEVPGVAMVKEASGNMAQIMEIARHKPERFSLLSGDDALTLPMLALGGDGCISVVANEIPREFAELVHLCLKGRWEKALRLHNSLLDLMNVNFIESNPIPVKTALAMMGKVEEVFRLPMVPMGAKNKEKLGTVLKKMKLL